MENRGEVFNRIRPAEAGLQDGFASMMIGLRGSFWMDNYSEDRADPPYLDAETDLFKMTTCRGCRGL